MRSASTTADAHHPAVGTHRGTGRGGPTTDTPAGATPHHPAAGRRFLARVTSLIGAPDPGRLRLRAGARAVLGIGTGSAAVLAAGLGLGPAVAGGLAALLALFTVADTTVAAQARTTAMLPVTGLPVLALAAALHGVPAARDAAFVAVVLGGVYARRWGPRGNAFGVFAFMMFFVAQFLHATPAALPRLCAAVVLAVAGAAAVRFGVWCYELGLPTVPAPSAPVPLEGHGLRAPGTRLAMQAGAAAALAIGAGEAISAQRWYWAVAAVWWIFVNTTHRGETLVRGFRRMLGTVAGAVAGLAAALPLHGAALPSALLLAVCVFGIFYAAPVSYSWMVFFVTVLAGVLYSLFGVLRPGLLALRAEETGAGAAAAAVAVLLVFPVTTHAATDAWIRHALRAVRGFTAAATGHLAGASGNGTGTGAGAAADLAARAAELDELLGRARAALAPLLHPLNPLRARRARARAVLAVLDDCALRVRELARSAAHPAVVEDARLAAAGKRIEAAIARLIAGEPLPEPPPEPEPEPVLRPGPLAGCPGEQPHEQHREQAEAGTPAGAPDSVRVPAPSRSGVGSVNVAHADAPGASGGIERALTQLRGLEAALTRLAVPLGAPTRGGAVAHGGRVPYYPQPPWPPRRRPVSTEQRVRPGGTGGGRGRRSAATRRERWRQWPVTRTSDRSRRRAATG
jgi:hypothetical protein